MSKIFNVGIIMAAGSSKRFGQNKLLIDLDGKNLISYVIDEFEKSQFIQSIVIVTSKDHKEDVNKIIINSNLSKEYHITTGEKIRQYSVKNGLEFIKINYPDCKYVLIHDGARPLITYKDIDKCLQAAVKHKAATLAIRPKDTIKQSEVPFSNIIHSTPPRELLWIIQTPQAFEFDLIYKAHTIAINENFMTTDDCALVERMGISPVAVEGDYRNIKVTTPEDYNIAKLFLSDRKR